MKLLNSDFVLSVFTVIFPVFFQLVFIWYVSNFIEQTEYGIFVIVNGLILAIAQAISSIPNQVVSRFYNARDDKSEFVNEMRAISYILASFSILILFISLALYSEYFSFELLLLCIIYIFMNICSQISQQIFLIKLHRLEYFKIKVVDGLSKFVAPIIGYIITPNFQGMLTGVILGQMLTFTYLEVKLSIYPRMFVIDVEKLKDYFKFAYPVLFSSVSSWIIVFSDRFFIEHFLEVSDVAWYSLLVQLAGFAQVLNILYTIYVTPTVLKIFETSPEKGILLLNSYLKKFASILLALFFVFLILPLDIFEILLGDGFFGNNDRRDVFVLVVSSVFLTVYQTAQSLFFLLFKKLRVYAGYFSFCALINFALNFFIESYGVFAAALSTLISYMTLNLLMLIWKRRFLKDEYETI